MQALYEILSHLPVQELLRGVAHLTWQQAIMLLVGMLLIYLGIARKYEPLLLVPIGFGAILANIPFSSAVGPQGWLTLLERVGIATELFPVLIFIALGAMSDFTPMLASPLTMLYGAAAQLGIFTTMVVATLLGFDLKEAAAIGIIGTADGPTTIYVASRFAKHMLGPLTVCAYTYMSLVPIIQPPIVRMLTTQHERRIRMAYTPATISRTTRLLFPIALTAVAGLVAPLSVALIGALMFGNLLRESGVTERLSRTAQNELSNLVSLLLGITVGSTMRAETFLTWKTLGILALGVGAFALSTAGGILFIKFLNLFRREKINPILGAAGVSAFPMSARVVAKMAQQADPSNYLIMHAVGANVAGIIASVMVAGLLLSVIQ